MAHTRAVVVEVSRHTENRFAGLAPKLTLRRHLTEALDHLLSPHAGSGRLVARPSSVPPGSPHHETRTRPSRVSPARGGRDHYSAAAAAGWARVEAHVPVRHPEECLHGEAGPVKVVVLDPAGKLPGVQVGLVETVLEGEALAGCQCRPKSDPPCRRILTHVSAH